MKHGFDSRTEYVPSVNASVFRSLTLFVLANINPSLPVLFVLKIELNGFLIEPIESIALQPYMEKTNQQFSAIIGRCRTLFLKKTADYGTSWRILRASSITDQLYIKALRIRNIQEKGVQMIDDSIDSEFVGIINYCILALIQLELPAEAPLQLDTNTVASLYDAQVEKNMQLLNAKNHDYGEAWRAMRISSMTDLILQKLLRVKQIEDNEGKTLVSEGLTANYQDMLNYAVFCLILASEKT
jgi:Nucleotide modification associated domain 1